MRCWMTLVRLLLILATLTTTGSRVTAQNPRQSNSRAKDVPKQPGGRNRVANNPLSDKDCRAFAQAIADAINAGDRAAFNALIDWDSHFYASQARNALPGTQRQDIMKQLNRTTDNETGFTGQLIKNAKAGAKFSFLRARQNQGRQVVEYRMILPEGSGGVSYFEFVVKLFADGKVRAADIYVFTSAELLSTTFRRALLPLVASLSRTFLDKLLRSEQDIVRDLPKVPTDRRTDQPWGRTGKPWRIFQGALGPETQKDKVDPVVAASGRTRQRRETIRRSSRRLSKALSQGSVPRPALDRLLHAEERLFRKAARKRRPFSIWRWGAILFELAPCRHE